MGELLDALIDFLSYTKQRVVLNDQTFVCVDTNRDVRQGSVMGALPFWIYINDFQKVYLLMLNCLRTVLHIFRLLETWQQVWKN